MDKLIEIKTLLAKIPQASAFESVSLTNQIAELSKEQEKKIHFEIGKYYKHNGGGMIHIFAAGKTTLYGWGLIAEEAGYHNLLVVGSDEESAVNWYETTEEEWMKNFS